MSNNNNFGSPGRPGFDKSADGEEDFNFDN